MVQKAKRTRISISVPQATVKALDGKIVEAHYQSRSQAIVDMIHRHLVDQQAAENEVMVGTLTLLYDRSNSNLRLQILDLQYKFLKQVVSSLHVQLNDNKILEVMIMQGMSQDLKQISQVFVALKGVVKGHLELMDAVMPPIEQN